MSIHVANGSLAGAKKPAAGRPVEESAVKYGRMRHVLALLALSSFVMANMNRQAYNQGLARMIKKKPLAPEPPPPPPPPVDHDRLPNAEGLDAIGELLVSRTPNLSPHADPAAVVVSVDKLLENQPKTQIEHEQRTIIEEEEEDDDDGYDWTSAQVGMLQAAFSYGYTVFMIPGGRLSEIYGAKWIIFLSSFGSAVCSLLTPFFANRSYACLVGSRVIMGICQTGVSPAMYAFCSRWLPPDEASVYLPMIKVGVMVGFMLGSLLNGFLPWRTMFYLVGLAGLAWSAVWALFATSDPRDHKFLHKKELAFIKQSLRRRAQDDSLEQRDLCKQADKTTGVGQGQGQDGDDKDEKKVELPSPSSSSAPWLGIITNPVVLAFTFTKFTVKMSTDTQSMQIPMYLRQVFNISDGLNGTLNGANFAIQAVFTGLVAYGAKEMVVRKTFGFNKTGVRVLFQCLSNFGVGLGYLLISFNMGSLQLVCGAVIVICVASMLSAGGEAVLPIDLTTEFSASIMAIANSAANMSGILLPPIVSYFIANDFKNSQHWNHVWIFMSSAMICGGLVFGCFVQAKIQDFEGKGKSKRNRNRNRKRALETTGNGLAPASNFVIQMPSVAASAAADGGSSLKRTTKL